MDHPRNKADRPQLQKACKLQAFYGFVREKT
jgi:hypothetical protein